jgi:hypothetical protein
MLKTNAAPRLICSSQPPSWAPLIRAVFKRFGT